MEPIEKRILRAERYIDALRYHLFITDQVLHNLIVEIADLKCENPEDKDICKRIATELESLQTLRTIVK
jgi:hypothetical protein